MPGGQGWQSSPGAANVRILEPLLSSNRLLHLNLPTTLLLRLPAAGYNTRGPWSVQHMKEVFILGWLGRE